MFIHREKRSNDHRRQATNFLIATSLKIKYWNCRMPWKGACRVTLLLMRAVRYSYPVIRYQNFSPIFFSSAALRVFIPRAVSCCKMYTTATITVNLHIQERILLIKNKTQKRQVPKPSEKKITFFTKVTECFPGYLNFTSTLDGALS